jgi:hypothetical protein
MNAFISTVNGLLNVFLWDISLTPSFLVGILGGAFGFVLNRYQKYELAKHSLLLIAIFFVFIFIFMLMPYFKSLDMSFG